MAAQRASHEQIAPSGRNALTEEFDQAAEHLRPEVMDRSVPISSDPARFVGFVVNHTSHDHPWFQSGRKGRDAPWSSPTSRPPTRRSATRSRSSAASG